MLVYYKNDYSDGKGAQLDVDQPHFRYGAGLFETILYDGIEIQHLDRHLDRLNKSSAFFDYKVVSFDYDNVIKQLLLENDLLGHMARVNICHLVEAGDACSVFISTNKYTPPSEDKVFKLCHYPEVHNSYMSRHKTMNYMHFMLAKKYANKLGCDDALLTDELGNVLETSMAAVVFHDGKQYLAPKSYNKLNSIAFEIFAEEHDVSLVDVCVNDLHRYRILLMNSLMGVRKAIFQES